MNLSPITLSAKQDTNGLADFLQSQNGKLSDHKVTKVKTNAIYYPEIGEQLAPEASFWKRVLKITLIVIGIITLPLGGIGVFILIGANNVNTKVPAPFSERKVSTDPYRLGKYYNANLRLTSTTDEGFKWKKKFIEAAESSIELSANFAGGSSFQEILELIEEQLSQKKDLKVHLIASVDLLEKDNLEKLKALHKQYGARFQHLVTDRSYKCNLTLHTEENHVKMLVVDSKYFVGGGTGLHPRLAKENYNEAEDKEKPTLSATILDKSAKDCDIACDSAELAYVMRKQFFNLYQIYETQNIGSKSPNRHFSIEGRVGICPDFVNGPNLFENVRLKFMVCGPEHQGSNAINRHYAKRIEKATTRVHLANWMLNPSTEIYRALKVAKKHHPKKKIVMQSNGLPGNIFTGRLPLVLLNRGAYHLADKAYEFQQEAQIYHKKVAIFDDSHTIIGSYNLSKKSAQYDHEVAFVIKDTRVTQHCRRQLKADAQLSRQLSREHIRSNKIVHAIGSRIGAIILENFM